MSPISNLLIVPLPLPSAAGQETMLFNSCLFLVFFPVVTGCYFLLRGRHRIYLLLVASAFFYMAFLPRYILILSALILVDYGAGIRIENSQGIARRRWLLVSLAATCAILFVFKYFNFAGGILAALCEAAGIPQLPLHLGWILPLGLSFHTFQSLTYVIEVYLGRQKAERDLPVYALYVMFYPQLVAGPIERPQNLLPQFRADFPFDFGRVVDGLRLMLWGFLKKLLIADRLAILVDHVYADPSKHGGPVLVLATFAFAFEIYCDFSGYSDIAIGAARVMGFRLMKNFANPYLASSVSEFWRRWHISLSTWFRDYLYFPLGGSQGSRARTVTNLLVVFAISGLWHGANWTFLAWGVINGAFLAVSLVTADLRTRLAETARRLAQAAGLAYRPGWGRIASIASTFLLINFTWIFFRAGTLADALFIVQHLARGWGNAGTLLIGQESGAAWAGEFGMDRAGTVLVFSAAGLMIALEAWAGSGSMKPFFLALPQWLRLSAYTFALWTLLLFGVFSGARFIYYTF